MMRRVLLTLLAVLALVAIPLAAGAGLCCQAPQAACCTQHCADPGICAPAPSGQAEQAQTMAPLAHHTLPLLTGIVPRTQGTPPPVPHEPAPRARTPLLEGGACLHTTVLPPPTLPA